MQKKEFLTGKREIKRIIWIVILNVALIALLLNIKSFNNSQYCFAKVNNEWFYGTKTEAIEFYNSAYILKEITNNIKGNYIPTFEELIEYNNRIFLKCYNGNWKNEST